MKQAEKEVLNVIEEAEARLSILVGRMEGAHMTAQDLLVAAKDGNWELAAAEADTLEFAVQMASFSGEDREAIEAAIKAGKGEGK